MLPTGSPWLCPGDDATYSESILWGVVGPGRLFGKLGLYSKLNVFFLIGLLAPVPAWALSLVYPEKKWLRMVNIPVILAGGAQVMPPLRMAYNWTSSAVGFFFSFYVYRRFKAWWARHVYVLCAGLDAGIILLGLLSYFAVQLKDVYGVNWWGLAVDDHCPLAHCPTAPGIVVDGCPLH